MEDIREYFIHCLTHDTIEGKFTRVFNENGIQAWGTVTLEMIMWNFDKVLEEINKE